MSLTYPMHRYACDACRRRKIRCDKTQPCIGCTTASLSCTFLAPSLPKGRQGHTANVISDLRSSQIRSIQGSIAERSSIRAAPVSCQSVRNTHLLTRETFNACVEFYFTQFHSSVPILEKANLPLDNEDFSQIPDELYSLILSFCAFIILQTGAVHIPSNTAADSLLSADIRYGQALIQEALETRRNCGPIILPSVQTVITSFLLYGCYRFLNDQAKAWIFLREATTLYLSGTEGGDTDSDLTTSPISAQLFWLLLSTERAYSIRKHRPLSILASDHSPSLEHLPSEIRRSAISRLVDLYRHFNEIFFGSWNGTSTGYTTEMVLAIETHLQRAVSVSMSVDLPEIQMADLLVSQQWLRMIVWQLSTRLGFLSSSTRYESLTFWYPINIARDLMISTWGMSQQSMQIHGIGLVEKLFDICYQLIDVMIYTRVPEISIGELVPEQYLSYLFSLIAKLRGGDERFIPLLSAKLEQSSLDISNILNDQLVTPTPLADPTSPPDFDPLGFEDGAYEQQLPV